MEESSDEESSDEEVDEVRKSICEVLCVCVCTPVLCVCEECLGQAPASAAAKLCAAATKSVWAAELAQVMNTLPPLKKEKNALALLAQQG